MSNENIWNAANRGNLDRIKYLIEIERIDVNIKDIGQGWVLKNIL